MKLKVSGGGIDAHGNEYKLPEKTVDVPDDWFQTALRKIAELPAPTHIILPGLAKMLREEDDS